MRKHKKAPEQSGLCSGVKTHSTFEPRTHKFIRKSLPEYSSQKDKIEDLGILRCLYEQLIFHKGLSSKQTSFYLANEPSLKHLFFRQGAKYRYYPYVVKVLFNMAKYSPKLVKLLA